MTETAYPPPDGGGTQPPPDGGTQAPPPQTEAAKPAYLEGEQPKMTIDEALATYDAKSCAVCNVGVVRVITFDPDAKHEVGQPIYFPAKLSGGSVGTICPNCGDGQTYALAPRDAPPNPNPGA